MSNIHLTSRLRLPIVLPALAFLFVFGLTATASAQSWEAANQDRAFEKATQNYARLHRRLEAQIGSIEFGTPVGEINRLMNELSAAIRAERGAARQGDFFTLAFAPVLRERINHALLDHGYTADDVREASQVDGVDVTRVRLKVNDTFPWVLATPMFACVIEALPALPPELQYRILGEDLLLIDVHASLVVDILPRALTDLTVARR